MQVVRVAGALPVLKPEIAAQMRIHRQQIEVSAVRSPTMGEVRRDAAPEAPTTGDTFLVQHFSSNGWRFDVPDMRPSGLEIELDVEYHA